jgi:Ca2+-binding RTX toxin-like protein
MATFTANTGLNMNTIFYDLNVLAKDGATWTHTVNHFTATSFDGTVEIDGDGGPFLPLNGDPQTGNLDSLNVYATSWSYSLGSLDVSLQGLINNINVLGPHVALESLLNGNDVITGSISGDILLGYGGNDRIHGGDGSDILYGGSGNDYLFGGPDNDTLTGGPGADRFVFSAPLSAAVNVDRITDFSPAADRIDLAHGIFAGTGAAGSVLSAAAFHVGHHAHDASDRIIYDKTTGALFYDSNGNAAGGEVKFAVVAHNLAITHADFLIL